MNTGPALPAGVQVFERGWLSANNILLVGAEDCALVDSGYCTHSAQTVALVQGALEGRRLDVLLNTHLHSDHCGGNAALQAHYPGLETRIPPSEAAAAAAWDEDALSYRATGQQCPRFDFNTLLHPGTITRMGGRLWEIHAAPGHDPASVILFEPTSRTLLSADALWEHGFGVVFPELVGEPSFDHVASTLELIEQLKPELVIPGHGAPFVDVTSALQTARQRLARQVANPARHARHALKVLIKFKLMETRFIAPSVWRQWIIGTPYFGLIRDRFFPQDTVLGIAHELLDELVDSGAASASVDRITDL